MLKLALLWNTFCQMSQLSCGTLLILVSKMLIYDKLPHRQSSIDGGQLVVNAFYVVGKYARDIICQFQIWLGLRGNVLKCMIMLWWYRPSYCMEKFRLGQKLHWTLSRDQCFFVEIVTCLPNASYPPWHLSHCMQWMMYHAKTWNET